MFNPAEKATNNMAQKMASLRIDRAPLKCPPLEEVASGNFDIHLKSCCYWAELDYCCDCGIISDALHDVNYDSFSVLSKGLQNGFSQVSVEVVDCPDLSQQPFTLAKQG